MTGAMVVLEGTRFMAGAGGELVALKTVVLRAVVNARAENTRLAYAGDWTRFVAWCGAHGLEALPASPETVTLYLAALAEGGKANATRDRALVSIAREHTAAGLATPTTAEAVTATAAGLRRENVRSQRRAADATIPMLRAASMAMGDDLTGLRNRALLLLGFAGGFRRSELVSLDVADLVFGDDGITATVRRSKTDQTGKGFLKPIPYGSHPATCPVRAVKAWLAATGLEAGPLFRDVRGGKVGEDALCDRTVARVVKAAATTAGLDDAAFSGHSLRAGLVTTAYRAGKSLDSIMATTGHKNVQTVMGYVRRASLFDNAAAAGIGL